MKFAIPYVLSAISILPASVPTATTEYAPWADSTWYSIPLNKESCIHIPEHLYTLKSDSLKMASQEPFAVSAQKANRDVLYIMNNGDTIRRSGGSLAWRNNNAGNLVYGPKTEKWGAIGKGPRGFAIFPDEKTGRDALDSLLRTSYANMSISAAIFKYAPPSENDVGLYLNRLKNMTGLNLNTKIGALNKQQLEKVMDAICVIEGWREGTTTTHAARKEQAMTELMAQRVR